MQTESKIDISFDDLNNIRILDPESFQKTENLAAECNNFTIKLKQFGTTVVSILEVLNEAADKIEKQKLMAIGLRNKVQSETESRKRRQQEISALIVQKQQELDRATVQLESLQRVEQDQKAMIEKLQKIE